MISGVSVRAILSLRGCPESGLAMGDRTIRIINMSTKHFMSISFGKNNFSDGEVVAQPEGLGDARL